MPDNVNGTDASEQVLIPSEPVFNAQERPSKVFGQGENLDGISHPPSRDESPTQSLLKHRTLVSFRPLAETKELEPDSTAVLNIGKLPDPVGIVPTRPRARELTEIDSDTESVAEDVEPHTRTGSLGKGRALVNTIHTQHKLKSPTDQNVSDLSESDSYSEIESAAEDDELEVVPRVPRRRVISGKVALFSHPVTVDATMRIEPASEREGAGNVEADSSVTTASILPPFKSIIPNNTSPSSTADATVSDPRRRLPGKHAAPPKASLAAEERGPGKQRVGIAPSDPGLGRPPLNGTLVPIKPLAERKGFEADSTPIHARLHDPVAWAGRPTRRPKEPADDDDDEVEIIPQLLPRRGRATSGSWKRGTGDDVRNATRMKVAGRTIRENQVFELVISDPSSRGVYKRIIFHVYAIFDATSPASQSSSYVHGTMYFLFSDYANAPVFGKDLPKSGVPPEGADIFLCNPGVRDEYATRESFLVDLPVKEIIHVIRLLGQVSMRGSSSFPETDVPFTLRCSFIYTPMRVGKQDRGKAEPGKGEHFTPIGVEKIPPMPPRLRVADFFCGTGGFSEGFRRAGFNIEFGVDNDRYASRSWQLNHPSAKAHLMDVTTLIDMHERRAISLPEIHVAIISPPCQGFSSANPGGKNDEKNRELLMAVADIARAFKPFWIYVENVSGLFLPEHRSHLRKLEVKLMSLGYSPSVVEQCASNFGVPQTRRRAILIATRRGYTQPHFPSRTHDWDSPVYHPMVTLRRAIGDLNHDYRTNAQVTYHSSRPCSNAEKEWPKADWDTPSWTVRTSPSDRWRCLHPDGQRLLTVRELCRIQSLGDNWQLSGPITEQYRQVGNAVPPLLAEAWARELRAAVLNDYPDMRHQFHEYAIPLTPPMGTADIRRADLEDLGLTSEEEEVELLLLGVKSKRSRRKRGAEAFGLTSEEEVEEELKIRRKRYRRS
ncbi:S-adenosyl-L-methionine-dependent methyltransferase [Mycena galericulata]|nr:S-adenosyl-L-methionine-dependent methyltransferase [Mycena galericulata]KAJ7483994.1 S-adenosyl-L-methionine-dependent methyltransferase [Mycena galericulata]